jgi:hypothetical protein
MIFWPFCAVIWFKNIEKMLLQMTSGFLQLESTLEKTLSFQQLSKKCISKIHNKEVNCIIPHMIL